MKNCYEFLAIVSSFSLVACASMQKPDNFNEPVFNSHITEESVDQFISKNSDNIPSKIILNSVGGEPIAAMRMGLWIFKNQISVEVRLFCLSSCANYLFTAGKEKTITAPGVVGWHGSAEQKNFRERDSRFDLIAQNIENKYTISEVDSKEFYDAKNASDYLYSKKFRPFQEKFFNTIQVNEYLTRLGQEPINQRHMWTTDKLSLANFGVCNFYAPLDYGSDKYLAQFEKIAGINVIKLTYAHVNSNIENKATCKN